jgi:hypothetical protein
MNFTFLNMIDNSFQNRGIDVTWRDVHKALVIVDPLCSGLEMAVMGTVSALAGYVVGLIFKVPTVL